jgi:hypothetical protein
VELYFGLAARYPEKMLHVPGGSKGGSKKSPVTPHDNPGGPQNRDIIRHMTCCLILVVFLVYPVVIEENMILKSPRWLCGGNCQRKNESTGTIDTSRQGTP